MATRNLGVALAPLFSLAEVDQQAIEMVVLGLPITFAFALGAGLLFRHTDPGVRNTQTNSLQ